jgi:hypothetical protein
VATPPLPDTPCIRVRLDYSQTDGFFGGNRLYFAYSGTAPTGAQCVALATYIQGTEFGAQIRGLFSAAWSLAEVDVLDIATTSGRGGSATTPVAGNRSGSAMPAQVAMGIEFNIAERYRGGKPRCYLPVGVDSDQQNPGQWTSTFTALCGTAWGDFIAGICAQGLVAANDLTHVMLSYYDGVNTSSPPWRGPGFKYPPKYRSTALHYPISGYAPKQEFSSQKRRRTASTY